MFSVRGQKLPENLNLCMDHTLASHPQAQCTVVLLESVLVPHNMRIQPHLHHTIHPPVPIHESNI